jgi:hypothetical protein
MRLRPTRSSGFAVGLLAAVAGGWAALPASARADVRSANWAGYAVHGPHLRLAQVSAVWQQPKVRCTRGSPTYSAFWVGLGGFNTGSRALEQIGTEADCTASGHVRSSAWYEAVPAPTRAVRLTVRPGDLLAASVAVQGHVITLRLTNISRGRSFTRALTARLVDVSSADWIAEAPSVCGLDCRTLPLADFGSTTFSDAAVQLADGRSASISSAGLPWSRISLRPSGRRFVSAGTQRTVAGAAEASPLRAGGSRFRVSYVPVTVREGRRRSAAASAARVWAAKRRPGPLLRTS